MSSVTQPPHGGDHHESAGLETGHLGRSQIVALAIASYTPAVALATVPFLLIVSAGNGSWLGALIGAVAIGCVGLSVSKFARRYVVTGSLYSYVAHVFGPWARVLMGASLFLAYIAMLAGVVLSTGIFAGSFLVSVGVDSGFGPGVQTIIAAVAVGVATGVAYLGLDPSVRTAVTLTVLTLPLVVVITLAAAFDTGLALGDQLSLKGASASGIFQGVAAGAVFLVAFESSAALAAETREPKRNVPLAIMSVPVVLGGAYVLVALLQVPALTAASDALASGVSPAAALALEAGLGDSVAKATDLVLAIANLASVIGFLTYGSRFLATLATDGLLPASAARVHPRHSSPSTAILSLSSLSLAALLALVWLYPDDILTKAFPAISTLTVYLWVVPYLLICAGAIVLGARERRLGPALFATAMLGAATIAWLYVNGIVNPPGPPADAMSYVGVIAVIAVFAFFMALDRRRRASLPTPRAAAGAEPPARAQI